MGLARHLSWTAISQVSRQVIQVALGVVLARLLTPEDFGLIGLTVVFTGFANLFSDLGLGAALVQRKDITDRDLNFVFWLNLLTGITLTIVTILCAPLIAQFYHEPRLIGITRLLGICPVISSLGLVPGSIMQKQFRFKALAITDLGSVIVSSVLACWAAAIGLGVMSLVIQAIAIQASAVCFRWAAAKWYPTFRLSFKSGRRLVPFGSGLLGSSLVNYWVRNGDNLLVGRFCGAVPLGLYSRSYTLMVLPVNQVNTVLSPVLFPALSLVQDSKAELRRVFLFANQAIAVIAFPLMLGLAVVTDDFVHVLWGDRWLGTVAIIRVLAIAGVGNAIGTTSGWIYMAVGRTDRMLWWTMASSPVYLLGFIAGLRWGAFGVAVGYAAAFYLVLWYPMWRMAGSLIDLSFRKIMTNLRGPFVCAAVMVAGIIALRWMLGSALHPAVRLLVSILTGACLYIGAIEIANVPAYHYLKGRAALLVHRAFDSLRSL
jgi:PST family polysaccharide transporter